MNIEQVPLQQSTERHHSIIDWLSRESSGLVRQSNMTSTNALLLLQCSSPPTTSRLHTSLTLSLSRCLLMMNIEQVPLQQSTEWHHSIIDWLSRESSGVVRQSNMTSTNALLLLLQCSSPPTSRLHTSRILTLSMVVDDDIEQEPRHQRTERHHSIIDWLSRET